MADVTVQTHVDTFMRSATASAARDALGIQSGATYSTVAEMVAADVTNITSGRTVTLTGYYAAGDFGEPLQLIVEASTGGIKSLWDGQTLNDGRYANLYADEVLVDWFGAKGDGVTDDASSLSSALNSGASKVLGQSGSTYFFDSQITITNSDLIIDWQGATLKAGSSFPTGNTLSEFISITADDVTFQNAVFDGDFNGGNGYYGKMLALRGERLTVKDNHFKNAIGCMVHSTSDASNNCIGHRILHNRFEDAGGPLADGTQVGMAWYMDNISGSNNRGHEFSNNYSYNTTGCFIGGSKWFNYNAKNVLISNNTFRKRGQITTRATQSVISGNIFDPERDNFSPSYPSIAFCVSIEQAYGITFTGNVCRGFTDIGLEVLYKPSFLEPLYDSILITDSRYLTSGTLVTGKKYLLRDFITGDDFSNIASVNFQGGRFTATGTTPTTWTNSSQLRKLEDGSTSTSGTLESGKEYIIENYGAGDDFDNIANINVDDSVFEATGTTPTTWANASKVIARTDLFDQLESTVSGNTFENTDDENWDAIQLGQAHNCTIVGNTIIGGSINAYGDQAIDGNTDPALLDDYLMGLVITNNRITTHPTNTDRSTIDIRRAHTPIISNNYLHQKSTTSNTFTRDMVYMLDCKDPHISDNVGIGFEAICREAGGNNSHTPSSIDNADGGGVLRNNRIMNDPNNTVNRFQHLVTPNGSGGRRPAPMIVSGNLHPANNFPETGSTTLFHGGWTSATVGASSALNEHPSGLYLVTDAATSSSVQARTDQLISFLRGYGINGMKRCPIIGEQWMLKFMIPNPVSLSGDTNVIARVIVGKAPADTNLGIVASYHQFGWEFRGKTIYGFYDDGTTTTYTPLIDTIGGGDIFAKQFIIQSSGGFAPSLHFFVSKANSTDNQYLKESLWELASGNNITDGTGGASFDSGVHIELENKTVASSVAFRINNIEFKDMMV